MIVGLNGPFGGGKEQPGREFRCALDGAVIADPGAIGDVLRRALTDHSGRTRDYQHLLAWREMTGACVTGLARQTRGPVIVPMTLLNRTYVDELFALLRQSGTGFHHVVLHAAPEVLQARIAVGSEYPGKRERSEAVRPTAPGAPPTLRSRRWLDARRRPSSTPAL
ncbi:AAA family ATPase [Streptomyces sp. NPDC001373]|uniref:AAA family ATPase n=1 Tax=Streptomyces sp. NPDC001373 TaxID=3364565 RepID=UPI00368D7C00